MQNEPLLLQWQDNTRELLSALSSIDDTAFSATPVDGGWSAAEIADHLLLIDKRLTMVLQGATTHVDRDPGAMISRIGTILENRTNRIDAPPAMIPSKEKKDKATLVENIRSERDKIATAMAQQDMSLANMETPHRFFGVMTGFEWIMFGILHTQRHLAQLAELKY